MDIHAEDVVAGDAEVARSARKPWGEGGDITEPVPGSGGRTGQCELKGLLIVDGDEGAFVDAVAELAIDVEGQPHICYFDASDPALRYAHLVREGWQRWAETGCSRQTILWYNVDVFGPSRPAHQTLAEGYC